MLDKNWEISNSGIGPIHFNMSRKEVSKYDSIYGKTTKTQNEDKSTEAVMATLKPLIGNIPGIEDQIREFQKSRKNIIVESRRMGSPILRYKRGHLIEILIPSECKNVHFENISFFDKESRPIVHSLFKKNGNIRFDGYELAFDQIGLFLQGYATRDSSGTIVLTTINHGDHDERLVKIVCKPEMEKRIENYQLINL